MTFQADKIVRSKRKTIALVVTPDAQLIIRAPHESSEEYINWVISKKFNWIKSKIAHVRKFQDTHKHKNYIDGEGFLYLGNWLRLRINKEQNQPLIFDGDFLHINESSLPNAKTLIDAWYKERSLQVITDRVNWFVNCFGFKYKNISITDAQRRWGSCGYKNTLNFSWRLVTAPMEVVDYVVIHELCHTIEKNHSESFWTKVKTISPKYKNSIKWLEQNQKLMEI
ncbi:MAG: SprT family zinc-dependent metalloprotease [Lentisphaerota bacterium]